MKNRKFYQAFRPIYAPFMTRLRIWSRRHLSAACFLKFLRRFSSLEFRQYVVNFRMPVPSAPVSVSDDIHLTVHKCGELNPETTYFLIFLNTESFGFCAQWITYLNRCNFAERLGMKPCIFWQSSELYQEEAPVHGTRNIFQYYYLPSAGVSSEEVQQSRFVVYDQFTEEQGLYWIHIPLVTCDYQFSEKDMERFAELQRKYCRLRPEIKASFQKQIDGLFHKQKVLAVHVRGCDMKIQFLNHPVYIATPEYIAAAKSAMKKIHAQKVFLATDDEDVLESFRKEFGDQLVYYQNVVRSKDNVMNCIVKSDRPLHKYNLGLEVLRDVYTLAACDGMVCGFSYVNCAARIVRRSQGKPYEIVKVLSKGFNKTGVDVNNAEYVRKNREVVRRIREMQENSDDCSIGDISRELDKFYGNRQVKVPPEEKQK